MQTQLYPAEYAEDSLERLLSERSRRSHVIYLVIIGALLAGLAVLPFVFVDVSVRSTGVVRPSTDKHEVRARASGLVEQLLVRENQEVQAGQPMLALRAPTIGERERTLAAQVDERRRAVHDLETILATGAREPTGFQTPRYRQAWAQFRTDRLESDQRLQRAVREAERTRALRSREMAPASEMEEKEFQVAQARTAASQLRERYLTGWQGDLVQARDELRELLAHQGRLAEELQLYRVSAPVSGTVEQLQRVAPGSYVVAGEPIAVISPTSTLQAEVYVTPRDIGMIRPGAPVRLQVDAFNYSDWGMATGRVSEISDDYQMIGGQPVFKVTCTLDQDHLALQSGLRGRLKKGMTLQARFVVARRSVFQLLYQNVNDWLNPVQAVAPTRAG